MEKYPNDDELIHLEIDGEDFELKRHNTEIYRFLGKFAIYNHIYHAPDNEDTVLYLFEQSEQIKKLAQHLIEKCFPMHVNIIEPLKTDIKTFNDMMISELMDDIEYFEQNGMEE